MTSLHALLVYQTALGPLWVVLLTLAGLPLANEIVQRAKGTRAQSLLQLAASLILSVPALGPILAKFPVVGDLLYIFAPQDKSGLPKPLLYKPSVTVGEILNKDASARVFVPLAFLALAMSMAACGVLKPLPQPTPAQYTAALTSCLENAGVSQGLAVGEQMLTCFEQPNETVQQYEQCAEQDSGALAVDVVTVVTECAIDSWIDFTPQPANAAPSARLLAAREVRAKALARLIAQRGGR